VLRGAGAGHAADLDVVDPAQLPFLPTRVVGSCAWGKLIKPANDKKHA
jgi:hypothetical protein